jgi:two-component sensor histidine kinase
MRLYNDLSDSIEKQTKEKNTLFESFIYELKKKDEEIRSKDEAIRQSAEAEVKSRNIRSYSIFVFLILSGMIYYMFSINRKLKKREQELEIKNAKIQSQNSTIQQALKEKDMLIKEVHHRVKNNLQLIISIINLQKQKGVSKESEGILDDLKFRIFSIANAHQMLYQKNSIQSVNIKEYIDSIFSNVKSSSEYPVSLSTEYENVEDINLGLDNAIIIGLMINEMFTNSVKHARKGKPIEITFKLKKDPWRNIFDFWFKDNGPGLPEDFHQIIRKSNSTGLELIYMLSQNLSANLEVYNDNGLCYHVRFEILSKEKQTTS